jgi:hypothetical protein
LQGPLLQVDEAEIVAHEADDPSAVVDLRDAEALSGEDGRDVDLLARHADADPLRHSLSVSTGKPLGHSVCTKSIAADGPLRLMRECPHGRP